MNAKLLAMLLSIGSVVVGGQTYTINLVAPGYVKADLIDAGVLPCTQRDVAVDVRLTDALADPLPDAGVSGRRHRRVLVDACVRADNNVILTDKRLYLNREPDPRIVVLPFSARPSGSSTVNEDAALSQQTHLCACRKATGTCQARFKGGALQTAPLRTVLGPDYLWSGFTGAGCEPMACQELAGDSAWPDVCPR